jgi:HAD superfamily hydrolase (TIGR01549 family)
MMAHESKKEAFRGVIFDLDGTLLDSFSVHFASYRTTCQHFGISITEQMFLSAYSPNWNLTYSALGLKPECWDAASTIWRKDAAKQHPSLFPGVKAAINGLRKYYRLGLVTSGSKSRVLRDLDRSKIRHVFDAIVTGEDVQHHKPSSEGLERALIDLGMGPEEVIYVGDALTDYEMARAARVAFVGVLSAFNSSDFKHPEFKLKSVTELPDFLRQLETAN